MHIELCPRCRGKGLRWIKAEFGPTQIMCGTCKGLGEKTYAASKEQRDHTNAKAKAKERKARKLHEAQESFRAQHPSEATWLEFSNDPWAIKMRDVVAKYGTLTDAQLKVTVCLARMNKGIMASAAHKL